MERTSQISSNDKVIDPLVSIALGTAVPLTLGSPLSALLAAGSFSVYLGYGRAILSSLRSVNVRQPLFWLGVAAGCCFRLFSTTHRRHEERSIISSPLDWVTGLSKEEQEALPYPPDALPGARDVDSPYGSIRVYEWGPEDGRKVLFVHGISTPCIALANLAEALAQSGCRVMLFDLFGRGYSSTPDPTTNPQNAQLFTSQILLVLASSPLSWTGSEGFSMIGYSLGGGISANFTSYFPTLVHSLILIAPSGLLRESHIHWTSRFLYGGYIPQTLVKSLVRKRMGAGSSKSDKPSISSNPEATPGKAVTAELPSTTPDPQNVMHSHRPSISVADAVSWQLRHHQGFLPAFISSIQHAPIRDQHERWRLIGQRLALQKSKNEDRVTAHGAMCKDKVLLVLGEDDSVIVADETSEDARAVFGEAMVSVKILSGGHDLPIVKSKEVADVILDF